MRRTISSRQTFFVKIVFPIIWIGTFSFVTLLFFFGRFPPDETPSPAMKWTFLAVALAGGASIYWFCMRLKRVEMDDDRLYVSNYMQEISVPLEDIADVRENRWVDTRPVTVTFRSDTDFGDRVVFMPTTRWWGFWRGHPVVEELRRASERARTTAR
jgi:hypothetical protein